jgi:hypothetical protein
VALFHHAVRLVHNQEAQSRQVLECEKVFLHEHLAETAWRGNDHMDRSVAAELTALRAAVTV